MDIYCIWAVDSASHDLTPYLVEAWDEYTMGENEEGWQESLAKAYKSHGAESVRVQVVSVPYKSVTDLYKPPKVAGKSKPAPKEAVEQ